MISSHPSNNHPRHFMFERNSRLPLSTFRPKPINVDRVALAVCLVGVVIVILATGAL